jgi:hypothetical protein
MQTGVGMISLLAWPDLALCELVRRSGVHIRWGPIMLCTLLHIFLYIWKKLQGPVQHVPCGLHRSLDSSRSSQPIVIVTSLITPASSLRAHAANLETIYIRLRTHNANFAKDPGQHRSGPACLESYKIWFVFTAYHLAVKCKRRKRGVPESSRTCSQHMGWLALWAANIIGKVKVHFWRLIENGLAVGTELTHRRIKDGIFYLVFTKDLVPEWEKISRGLGIPGYRGNREIPTGSRMNSKFKFWIQNISKTIYLILNCI